MNEWTCSLLSFTLYEIETVSGADRFVTKFGNKFSVSCVACGSRVNKNNTDWLLVILSEFRITSFLRISIFVVYQRASKPTFFLHLFSLSAVVHKRTEISIIWTMLNIVLDNLPHGNMRGEEVEKFSVSSQCCNSYAAFNIYTKFCKDSD